MSNKRTPAEIAHEGRGNLAVIQLTVETLMATARDDVRPDLETILAQVQKLAKTIDELATLRD